MLRFQSFYIYRLRLNVPCDGNGQTLPFAKLHENYVARIIIIIGVRDFVFMTGHEFSTETTRGIFPRNVGQRR